MKKIQYTIVMFLIVVMLEGCSDFNEIEFGDNEGDTELNSLIYLDDGTLINPFKITVDEIIYYNEIDFSILELNEFERNQDYYDLNGEIFTNDELIDLLDQKLDDVGYFYVELTFENILDYKIDYFTSDIYLCEGSNVKSQNECSRNFRLMNTPTDFDENMDIHLFTSHLATVADRFKYKDNHEISYVYDEEYTMFNGTTPEGVTNFEPGESKKFYLLVFRQNVLVDKDMSIRLGRVSNTGLVIEDEVFTNEYSLPSDSDNYEYYGPLTEGAELVSYKSTR